MMKSLNDFVLCCGVSHKDTLSSIRMDGCPTAQLAARTAAGSCYSSRCRIAGRDFCHELMDDAKLPVKTEDMWKTLFWHWFDKPLSFSKQAAYSDRARDVLRACQTTVHSHWREIDWSTVNGVDPEQKQFFFMAHEMSTQYCTLTRHNASRLLQSRGRTCAET